MGRDLSFALLAPVPYEHLVSSLDTIAAEDKVALGSRAWEVFRELDDSLQGAIAPVLIYASHEGAPFPPKVSWKASYLGHCEAKGGKHPAGMQYRPESTEKYPMDNAGHWAVFWEVSELQQLSVSEQIPISSLKSATTGKNFASSFRPEGPTVILNPFV